MAVAETRKNRLTTLALTAAAGAALATMCASRTHASTATWTRANATSNSWSRADNWVSGDGATLPPNAADVDIYFVGTPVVGGSITQDNAFTVHGIIIGSDFNPSGNFNISGSGTNPSARSPAPAPGPARMSRTSCSSA